METITSRENAKIKYACAVRDSEKQRAADGRFFAEGPKFETPVPPADTLDTARRILMLEGVQDPGNVGTLLRSAAAFGFDAVVLGPGCASPLSPKTLRSSMGAAGRLPTLHSDDLPAGRGRERFPGRAVRRHRQRGAGPDGQDRRGLRHGRPHPDDRPRREFERGSGRQRAAVAFQRRVKTQIQA